ncbi:MAG: lytic transglycosylase F [Desulfobacterales bacterium]|jgi:membrane-bound lytic murein transglycosylase MltF
MHRSIRTSAFLLHTILSILFIAINATEARAIESDLKLGKKWSGDFDGMAERHLIRALVPPSKTFYFLDGADQRGLTYELLKEFETYLNKEHKRKALKIKVVVIPTRRDRLLPGLVEGIGDIAAGNLTITPARQKQVDFSSPHLTGVDEIIITGSTAPPIATIDDLSGREIHVRKSSSYYESLLQLNARFKKSGKKPIKLIHADEYLEDEDLLEMIDAGLIPMIVMDSHKAEFWAQVFQKIRLHPDIKLRSGGQIAWAIRKKSPKLQNVINRFIKSHKKGTLKGNILYKRYLQNTKWVRNALTEKEFQRFKDAVKFFKRYSKQYDFDWLMIAAQAYQESGIDQSRRSPAGAIGVMQLLPSTAADPNVNIRKIEVMEHNIHAGVKYLRFLHDRYYKNEPMDALNKMLFSFASYNAGPGKLIKLRKEASESGFDPNIWFRNVEIIVAQRIGAETVQYVSNIYKYYIAYRFIVKEFSPKKEEKIQTN